MLENFGNAFKSFVYVFMVLYEATFGYLILVEINFS